MNDLALPPQFGLSLCAGGGGLDMGLGLAEPGFATSCYVEWEEYPRQTLIEGQRAGYLHPAPIWDNVKTFDGRPWRGLCDTILAGYPCQPFSQAGQRKGERDPRHLWPDIERIVREVDPTWVFLENVAGHLSLGLDAVLRALRSMGFTVAVGVFSAEEVGSSHQRQRVFIVAYSASCRQQASVARQDGLSIFDRRRSEMADTGRSGSSQSKSNELPRPIEVYEGGATAELRVPLLHPPGPGSVDVWRSVLAEDPGRAPALSLSDVSTFARYLEALVEAGELHSAQVEPRLCRMAHGLAKRPQSLRLLGNGVHPLAAANAWRSLSYSLGLWPVDLGRAREDDRTETVGVV